MNERDVEKFLFREARLMDEHRYDEWLSLWTQDAFYWIPSSHEQREDDRMVSVIRDGRDRLESRVARLNSGEVMAQDPKPRLRRVISNIEIEETPSGEVMASSNFILVYARGSDQFTWCGRTIHTLQREGNDFKIAKKKVLLVNSEQEMPALQFLI